MMEVSYNILTEFGVTTKVVSLIQNVFNKVRTGKLLCDVFLLQNDLKREDALSPQFHFKFAREAPR